MIEAQWSLSFLKKVIEINRLFVLPRVNPVKRFCLFPMQLLLWANHFGRKDKDVTAWPVSVCGYLFLNAVYHFHAVDNLTKYGVLAVKMRRAALFAVNLANAVGPVGRLSGAFLYSLCDIVELAL